MYKKLKEAESPADMRAAVESYARGEWDFHGANAREFHHPLIHHVLTMAHIRKLSPEDTYSMLAYYALKQMIDAQRLLSDHLFNTTAPRFIVVDPSKPPEQFRPYAWQELPKQT